MIQVRNFAIFLFLVISFSSKSYTKNLRVGNPFIKTYSIKNYLAGPINRAVDQDKYGVLYFGNNYGLLTYDGTRWGSYYFDDGLAVMSLLVDDDEKRIYVGSQGEFGFFSSGETQDLNYTSLKKKLEGSYESFNEVYDVYKVNEGIVFCAKKIMFIYHGDQVKAIPFNNHRQGVKQLGNRLYLIDNDKGLVFYEENKFSTVPGGEILRKTGIVNLHPLNKKETIVVTSSSGLYLMTEDSIRPWETTNDEVIKSCETLKSIKSKQGLYVLGTDSEGVICINAKGEIIAQYKKANGLQSSTVYDIIEDKTGNFWLGHNNGISYMELSSPFKFINESANIRGSGNTVLVFKKRLYMGTSNGLFSMPIENKNVVSKENLFEFIEGSQGIVLDLFIHKNNLLVAHNEGIFMLNENDELEKLHETEGAWKILKQNEEDDQMIIGTYTGLQLLTFSGKQSKIKKLSGFDEGSRVLEFDEKGTLWVTHGLKGVYKINLSPKKDSIMDMSYYNKKHGFPSNYHINVFKINGEVIFTGRTGVFKYDYEKDSFFPYDKFDQVLGQDLHIRALEEDDLGNIYFWSEEYAGVLLPNGFGKYIKESKPFNKILRLVDDGIIQYISTDRNNLFIGSNEGFVHYGSTGSSPYLEGFSTILRKVEIFAEYDSIIYQSFTKNDEIPDFVIPYKNNSLRFSCSAVFYSNKEYSSYQYYIENFDENWQPWTSKAEKEYINLPEGKYVFHVRAKNIYDIISNEVKVEFEILPPWYRHKIAYLIYALTFILTLFLAFRAIRRSYKKENRRIEEEKEQQLQEKESELQDVSRKSQEEIMQLKNEKLKNEINHKNKELASSTMHLINKNKFLSEVKDNLSKTVKQSGKDADNSELNAIISEIDRNIDNDSDWEQFQFHFDHVHGDFSKRFREAHVNLSPQDMKIAAYLRMNLSSKEMAQLLHISLRGVEKSRYRLRKKLNLAPKENLAEFILNF